MSEDSMRQALVEIFREEFDEQLQLAERSLEALRKDHRSHAGAIDLFRATHSVKGAARAVELRLIERVAAVFEDLLPGARRDEPDLTPDLVPMLELGVRILAECRRRIAAGEPVETADLVAQADWLTYVRTDGGLPEPTEPARAEAPEEPAASPMSAWQAWGQEWNPAEDVRETALPETPRAEPAFAAPQPAEPDRTTETRADEALAFDTWLSADADAPTEDTEPPLDEDAAAEPHGMETHADLHLLRHLKGMFCEELAEHVAALNAALLILEKTPQDAEQIAAAFRAAHSMKGAARAVGEAKIEAVCHILEERLSAVREGRSQLDAAACESSFRLVDQVSALGQALQVSLTAAEAPAASVEPGPLAPFDSILDPVAPAFASQLDAPAFASQLDAPAARLKPGAPTPKAKPVEVGESVRVAVARLDTLLSRSNELLAARRRVEDRGREVDVMRFAARRWRRDFRSYERKVREYADLKDLAERPQALAEMVQWVGTVVQSVGAKAREQEQLLDGLAFRFGNDRRNLEVVAEQVQDEVQRVRMLPFAEACRGLDRAARDLGKGMGKSVDLALQGQDLLLDRTVLEGLRDPLLHLLRNAMDHGLETPAERLQAGKVERGRISIGARLHGDSVEIEVRDDGRGFDLEAIRRKLFKLGRPVPADERGLLLTLFDAGFSTRDAVNAYSGRGVGLDVVKSQVEKVYGTVEAGFVPGVGSSFLLRVPTTLTTQRVLLVTAGGRTFGMPSAAVARVIMLKPEDVTLVEGRRTTRWEGQRVPVLSLAQTLGLPVAAAEAAWRIAVVVKAQRRLVAVEIDQALLEQEVVVKSLGKRLRHLPAVAGGTVLPSGKTALLINPNHLVGATTDIRAQDEFGVTRKATRRRKLMIVDDSLVTRSLVKARLEAAGYEVEAAGDGETAWRLLRERGAELLVTDVDMPGINGFMLASTVRNSAQFKQLPIVMVTSRNSAEDRKRGQDAGVNAYMAKAGFDQSDLLATVARLLEETPASKA